MRLTKQRQQQDAQSNTNEDKTTTNDKEKEQQQTSKEYMNKQDRDKSDDNEPIDQPLTNSQPIVLLTHPLIVH